MRVLVTGATGFIGQRVVHRIDETGHVAVALARRDWTGSPAIARERRYFGRFPFDLPPRSLTGADAVVHCAAISSPQSHASSIVNAVGTVRLARMARASGVSTFVFLSSQSARPETPSPYGRSKYEAEQALLGMPEISVIVLRAGLVCGPGGLFGRMARVVTRAPAVPVVAPGAPVQPILVDDLVAAILRCIEDPAPFSGRVLNVGLEQPLTLAHFLRLIAAETRGRVAFVPVPTRPIAMGLRLAERIGLRLPVNSANLTGSRVQAAMPTEQHMRELGLRRRTADEIVHLALTADASRALADHAGPGPGAKRVLLVGAGRIGLVHALTLQRLPGATLAGVADPNARARRILASIGVRTRYYASLESALQAEAFDAAVIATPPSTHLRLTRKALEAGADVLIEKPAGASVRDLDDYRPIAAAARCALVGYLMPGAPHVAGWLRRLREGEFGRVLGFSGFTLLTLIGARGRERWETRPEVAGGGVLANSGTHVLSLIVEAFGRPRTYRVEACRLHSAAVEDSTVTRLEYEGFGGVHYASWSMPGYPRQENRLVVRTERGALTVTTTMTVFESNDRAAAEIDHQLDHDLGFNLAPDYAGGGIAAELSHLVSGCRSDGDQPVTLSKAIEIERLLFDLYAGAERVSRFEALPAEPDPVHRAAATPRPSLAPALVADLRDISDAAIVGLSELDRWAGLLVFTRQLATASRIVDQERITVTVPDFLGQTRLLNDSRYADVVRSFTPVGFLKGSAAAAIEALRARQVGFWVAATALLAADLDRIPRSFRGSVLLHPYLVDLCLAVDDLGRLSSLFRAIHSRGPALRPGLHSNLAREAANAACVLDPVPRLLSALMSPATHPIGEIREWFATARPGVEIVIQAEVGPGPFVAQAQAAEHPDAWAGGADRLVVSARLDDGIRRRERAQAERDWQSAFPGLPFAAPR